MSNLDTHPRAFALLFSAFFVGMIYLYFKEFPVFGNTIGIKYLVIASILCVLLLSGACIWYWRDRFQPWDRHLPEVFFILLIPMLFAPLWGSLLNRKLGHSGNQSFEFVSETPYIAQGYGFLHGESVKVSGYHLRVKYQGKQYRFAYKEKAYPLTKPGDIVYLPVRWGILGATVVEMK